jgi:hypothetical protein
LRGAARSCGEKLKSGKTEGEAFAGYMTSGGNNPTSSDAIPPPRRMEKKRLMLFDVERYKRGNRNRGSDRSDIIYSVCLPLL